MAIERSRFIEILQDSYGAYYDVFPEGQQSALPLAFRADYLSRAEKYWLTKSIRIWGNETNEFAYVFSASSFNRQLAEKCVQFALDEGLPRVKPHKEHQYTNIKVVFVAEHTDDDVIRYIKRKSFSKSYRFSFHGFTNLLCCIVDLSEQKTYTNKAGYDQTAYFRKLFAAQDKKAASRLE